MLRYLTHPYQLLGFLVAALVGLYLHNATQAAVARSFGDPAGVRQGFLAPSRRQIDPYGLACMLLTFYAWGFAAIVPVNTIFRRQRLRSAVALMSGPVALFGLLLLWELAYRGAGDNARLNEITSSATVCTAGLLVTSLLPLPPMSLGRAIFLFTPQTAGWQKVQYQLQETTVGQLVILAILILPLAIGFLPDIVGQFADPGGPLLRHTLSLVGVPVLGVQT